MHLLVVFIVGRVDLKGTTRKNKSLDKQQRRHQAKQIRKNQRDATLDQKRGLGTTTSAPHIIVSRSKILIEI